MKTNKFWLIVFAITTMLFWGLLGANDRLVYVNPERCGQTTPPLSLELYIAFKSLIKFLFYTNLIIWFNSVFILRIRAKGIDTETWEFQKRQVYMTLFIFIILIVMEIPIWLSVL